MTTRPDSLPPIADKQSVDARFGDARWSTRWLMVGLGFMLLWRSVALVDHQWLAQVPVWVLVTVTGLVPQCFLLLFPLVTRQPRGRLPGKMPSAMPKLRVRTWSAITRNAKSICSCWLKPSRESGKVPP